MNKSIAASEELELRANKDKADIFLIQEPRVVKEKIMINLNGYEVFKQGEKSRACIISKSNLGCKKISDISSRDVIFIGFENNGKRYIVGSVYWDITITELPNLEKVVERAKNEGSRLLIGGDMNAWSYFMVGQTKCERGYFRGIHNWKRSKSQNYW